MSDHRENLFPCPLCTCPGEAFHIVQGVQYGECKACDFIFADPALLARVDAGVPLRLYDDSYWASEVPSAKARSYGSSLARVAEAILYCTIPVERFIDIGTGPGFLLDALSAYLPGHASRFYGVEKFLPPAPHRTRHTN